MPGTYSEMMSTAIRPKKWFEMMDPLVDQWRAHFYPEIDDWSAYDSSLASSHPNSFDDIIDIFGGAPRLAKCVERNPELLANLKDREFTDLDIPKGFGPDLDYEATARSGLTRLYWTFELGVQEMREQIAEIPSADAKDSAEIVRNWANDKAFQIGMHVMRGNLVASEARVAMSNLAEASIHAIFDAVHSDLEERYGQLHEAGVAGILLGDLASREVYQGVAMRVAMVYDGDGKSEAKRFAHNCRDCLVKLGKDSLVFAAPLVDAAAIRVIPLSELSQHYADAASSGNFDLIKARCIFECGDTNVAAAFEKAREETLATYRTIQPSSDSRSDVTEETVPLLSALPLQLEELTQARVRLQFGGDGLTFEDPAPTDTAVLQYVGKERLAQASTLRRDLQSAHALICGTDFDMANSTQSVKQVIASASGYETFDAMSEAAAALSDEAREELESVLAA